MSRFGRRERGRAYVAQSASIAELAERLEAFLAWLEVEKGIFLGVESQRSPSKLDFATAPIRELVAEFLGLTPRDVGRAARTAMTHDGVEG